MSRSFTETAVAKEVIESIKNGELKNSLNVYSLLNQIINDLPNTSVAKEAQKLKDELFD